MSNIKIKPYLVGLILLTAPIYIPLVEVIVKSLFTLGGSVGTYVRLLLDNAVCF